MKSKASVLLLVNLKNEYQRAKPAIKLEIKAAVNQRHGGNLCQARTFAAAYDRYCHYARDAIEFLTLSDLMTRPVLATVCIG